MYKSATPIRAASSASTVMSGLRSSSAPTAATHQGLLRAFTDSEFRAIALDERSLAYRYDDPAKMKAVMPLSDDPAYR